jgi:hypothetical protein
MSQGPLSLTKHISKVVEASGKKSLLAFIFSADGLLAFGDGNFACVALSGAEGGGSASARGRGAPPDALCPFAPPAHSYNRLIKGPVAGTLVGTDPLGNTYYENNELPYGAERAGSSLPSETFCPCGSPCTPSGSPDPQAASAGWCTPRASTTTRLA